MDAKVEHKNETGSVQQSTEQWMCGMPLLKLFTFFQPLHIPNWVAI